MSGPPAGGRSNPIIPAPATRGTPTLPDRLPIPVVDNHTHFDIRRDDATGLSAPGTPVSQLLDVAESVGVNRFVQIGCDLPGARFTIEQIEQDSRLVGGVALHPNEAPRLAERGEYEAAFAEIEQLAQHPRVRVVGETGLDYFRTDENGRAAQHESFRRHIDLAKRLGKVLQIHDRDSHDDVLRILREEGAPEHTVMHCFSGGIHMARECVDAGYYLSFSGTITFKNAHDLRDALSITPLEQVLVETDAPYLTPHPHRGAVNEPALMPITVRVMASVLGEAVPTLCTALSENAERLYGPW